METRSRDRPPHVLCELPSPQDRAALQGARSLREIVARARGHPRGEVLEYPRRDDPAVRAVHDLVDQSQGRLPCRRGRRLGYDHRTRQVHGVADPHGVGRVLEHLDIVRARDLDGLASRGREELVLGLAAPHQAEQRQEAQRHGQECGCAVGHAHAPMVGHDHRKRNAAEVRPGRRSCASAVSISWSTRTGG